MKKNLLFLFFLFIPFFISAQTIRYVKQGGAGLKNGSSWANASDDLQLMINSSIGNDEVWVAKGKYLPTRKYGRVDILSDTVSVEEKKLKVFTIPENVKVYGGFPDTGNPVMSDRDWRTNETILSGDIGVVGYNYDNSTSILQFVTGSTARVDGFTVRDAYFFTAGIVAPIGTVFIDKSSPILANLKITNNYSIGNGTGIYIRTLYSNPTPEQLAEASPLILNCIISDNTTSSHGGGVCVQNASPTFVNCLITENSAERIGGGMFFTGSGNIKLINTTVAKNKGKEDAGGIAILNQVKLSLLNTIVYENSISGGLVDFFNAHPRTTTFINENSIVGGDINPFKNMNAGDYYPAEYSSAFNRGNNSYYNEALYGGLDLMGNPRKVNSKIDIGAIENQTEIIDITPTNNVLYVKKGATGRGDGSSWANAIPELADALKWAKLEQERWTNTNVLQIWVAQGIYTPKYAVEGAPFSTDKGRENAFVLADNTQLYGGFKGIETSLSQRDYVANETILSGEIGDPNAINDNIHNVVVAVKILSALNKLDGFTIRDGNSFDLPSRTPITPRLNGISVLRDSGAGIALYRSDLTILNCKITDNQAIKNGGGLYMYKGKVTVVNCLLARNNKQGVYIDNDLLDQTTTSYLDMVNTTVVKNTGQGVLVYVKCYFDMNNSILSGNTGANLHSSFQNLGTIKNSLISTTGKWRELWGIDGKGNLLTDTDPFNNLQNNDFRLSSSSVAKNKGSNNLYSATNYGTKDLAGNNRIIGTIDMGAYELLGSSIASPTANANQYFCISSKLTDLSVNKTSGAQLYWYSSATAIDRISDYTVLENNKTYYVSQTKDNNESSRIAITAIAYSSPVINLASQKNVSCNGGNDGSIEVSVSNGKAPYTYLWSANKGNTTTASNLTEGTYTLTVTDDNGCSVSQEFTITQPDTLSFTATKVNVSSYGSATGSATVNGTGGDMPYKYLWSNGSTTATISSLTEGSYSVAITDKNNCTVTAMVYIDGPPATPTGLMATFGDAKNTLTWNANADADLKEYKLYGGTTVNSTTLIATLGKTVSTYTHTNLTNGLTYYYRLKAVDQEGNESVYSLEASAMPKAPQMITFNSLLAKTYGDVSFSAGAAANSGLSVSYTSSNTNVAVIENGLISIVGIGKTNIVAHQNGSDAFTPAASVTQELVVNKKNLSLLLKGAVNKVYDGTNAAILSLDNYEIQGLVGLDTVALNNHLIGTYNDKKVGNAKAINVNNLSISGAKAINYNLTTSALNANVGNISKKEISLTLKAQPLITKIYNANVNATLAAENYLLNGLVQNDEVTVNGTAFYDNKNVAEAKQIYVNGFVLAGFDKDNYTLTTETAVVTGDITKKAITLSLTNVPSITKVYDGTILASLENSNYLLNGIEIGDVVNVSGTATYNNKHVGIKQIAVTDFELSGLDNNNYNLTTNLAEVSGNITAKTINVLAVTDIKTYDGTNVSIQIPVIDILEQGDEVSTLPKQTFDTKNVGQSKKITPYGLEINDGNSGANYDVNYVSKAIGTVTPAVLSYVATPKTRQYGDANPILEGTVIGFVDGESQGTATTGSLLFTTAVDVVTVVGDYTITGSGLLSNNYIFEQAITNSLAFKITPRLLTISADAKTKIYGDLDPLLTYQITEGNLVNGDVLGGSLSRLNGENVGTYLIDKGSLSIRNDYKVTFQSSNLVVTKALLKVSLNNTERCYGINNPLFTVTYNGFKNGDNAQSLLEQPTFKTEANLYSEPNIYLVEVLNARSNNYDFQYINGTLTVNALPVNTIVSDKGNNISKGEIVILTVNSDNGTKFNWASANGILSGAYTSTLYVRPTETTTYKVAVTNTNGCVSFVDYTIEVKEDYLAVQAENFITPNADGTNDVWVIKNIDMYPNHILTIVDRGGRVVYQTRNYQNNWDGTSNGQPLSEGTYYYTLRFDNNQPQLIIPSGFITIVRGN